MKHIHPIISRSLSEKVHCQGEVALNSVVCGTRTASVNGKVLVCCVNMEC